MFQNTLSTEVRCVFVDLILMGSILGSLHVEAILCDKGAGKKPGDTLDYFACPSVCLNIFHRKEHVSSSEGGGTSTGTCALAGLWTFRTPAQKRLYPPGMYNIPRKGDQMPVFRNIKAELKCLMVRYKTPNIWTGSICGGRFNIWLTEFTLKKKKNPFCLHTLIPNHGPYWNLSQ